MKRPLFHIPVILLIILMSSCDTAENEADPCNRNFTIEVVETLDAVEGESIGSITVSSKGGNGMVTYSIDGNNFQDSGIFDDLDADTYTITAKDQLGCVTTTVTEVRLVLPVSFSEDIQPILQNNCMIPSCHCDGNPLCFDNYETVSANAEQIAKRTASRNMPPDYSGRVLTDDQIQAIANWVNQGAREN